MYAKYSEVLNLGGTPACARDFKLKQYHHVRLDLEFKEDCRTWLKFLEGEFRSVVSRPMVDLLCTQILTSEDITFYSDASTSEMLGFGCILNSNWIQGFQDANFIRTQRPSIEFLELYALAVGILTWGSSHPELKNNRITVFCDNEAIVHVMNGTTSSCANCMTLLRLIVLDGLINNRHLTAKYVKLSQNGLADSLS